MNKLREYLIQFSHDRWHLSFDKHPDRYQHSICSDNGKVAFESLATVNFETPVFTDVHEQDGIFYLSGSTVDLYWSMSICEFAYTSAPGGLAFDVACRVKRPVDRLGSAYRVPRAEENRLAVPADILANNATIQRHSDRIHIIPHANPSTFPATIRYNYEIFDQG